MKDRTGQTVRIILIGNRFYKGKIIEEDNNLILIIDKFGREVSIGKQSIVSMEEVK